MAQAPTPWWARPSTQQTQPPATQNFNNGYSNNFFANNQPMARVIPGRYVETEDDIKPNDVPMDGSVGYFPTSDFSAIIAKAWSNDGQIRVMRYVPDTPKELPKPKAEPPKPLTEERVGQIIDQKLNQLIEALTAPQPLTIPQPTQQAQPPKKTTKKEETTQ